MKKRLPAIISISLAALLVLLAIILVLDITGIYSFKYIPTFFSNSTNSNNVVLENNLEGHTFKYNSDARVPQAVASELQDAQLNSYNVAISIQQMPQEKGFFATTQTLGNDSINISGVNVEVDDSSKTVELSIYINTEKLSEFVKSETMTDQEIIEEQINKNYILGMLYAANMASGTLAVDKKTEDIHKITYEITPELDRGYFITYE